MLSILDSEAEAESFVHFGDENMKDTHSAWVGWTKSMAGIRPVSWFWNLLAFGVAQYGPQ